MARPLTTALLTATLTLVCSTGGAAALERPPGALGGRPFWWGVTLAGFQNDGGHPAMDWHAWETEWAKPRGYEISGKGADFRGHMEQDLDLARSLGLTAFRTSVEWARMEPEEGRIDASEVAYTHRLLRGIRRRGMTPVIALHHFATPKWFNVDHGDGLVGWESPRAVEAYVRWATFCAKEFGADIDVYLTFNEASNVVGGGYAAGVIPPYRVGPVSASRALGHVLAAHEAAFDAIHAADPVAQVSMPDYNCQLPVLGGLDYMPGKWLFDWFPAVRGWDGRPRPRALDFVAIHYYGTNKAFTNFPIAPWHWAGNPPHLEATLKAYWDAYHLPILIAESGFATRNGEPRADGWTRESFLVAHLDALQRVRDAGIPVLGYMYWTLTDNYEWGSFDPRFGLWSVDARHGDYARRPTPAVGVYKAIIEAGGVTPELRRRYPPPKGVS